MTGPDMLVLAGATLLASVIKGGAGMGAGLFLQPALTLIFDPFTALALSSPILLYSDGIGLIAYRREWIESRRLFRLLAACILGSVLGVLTVPLVSANTVKLIVGICGISFTLSKCVHKAPDTSPQPVPWPILFLSAVAGGFFNAVANAGGIFFAYCCLRMNLQPRTFVATIVIVVFTTSLIKVPGYLSLGVLSEEQLIRTLPLIPIVFTGAMLGSRCNKLISPKLFKKAVLMLIGIMSGSTLITLL